MRYPSYIAKVINNRAVLGEYQAKLGRIHVMWFFFLCCLSLEMQR